VIESRPLPPAQRLDQARRRGDRLLRCVASRQPRKMLRNSLAGPAAARELLGPWRTVEVWAIERSCEAPVL